jgi:hypothetical protein
MLIYAIKVSIKIHPNIENYGRSSKKILLEKRRKRKRKTEKEKENEDIS